MTADMLRQAADKLRGPGFVDHNTRAAIAEWLTETADLQVIADAGNDHAPAVEHALAVAYAVLRGGGESA